MPLSEVQRFHEQLKHDSNLFHSCNEALQGLSDAKRTQGIVEFAKTHGFNFSAKELQKYEELLKKLGEQNNKTPPKSSIYQLYAHWLHFWQNLFFYLNWLAHRQKPSTSMPDKKHESSPQPSPNKPKLSVNALERFFIWLSGSSPKILATCPDSEQRKHAALGGTVLIPVLFSVITSSFLLYTLNVSLKKIILATTIWAIIILMMDRALLATYRDEHSNWAKFWRFLLRFFIAFIIAMTIAHPTVLFLFSGEINNEYDKEVKIPKHHELLARECGVHIFCSRLAILEEKLNSKEQELDDFEKEKPPACKIDILNTQNTLSVDDLLKQKKGLISQKGQANQKYLEAKDREIEERKGICKRGRTCIKGCGSKCQDAIADRAKAVQEEKEIDDKINSLDNDIKEIQKKQGIRDAEFIKQQGSMIQACENQQKTWPDIRKPMIQMKKNDVQTLTNEITNLKNQCNQKEIEIGTQKPDILSQTRMLHEIILGKDGKAMDYGSLFTFLTFMLLFLMIDMLAVILKFTSTGVYDLKVNMDESNSALLSSIEYHTDRVAHFIQAELGEREMINTCKYGKLKQKLENALDLLEDSFCDDDHGQSSAFFKARSNSKK